MRNGEWKIMMYPYMTLADETEIVHSQIIEEDGKKKVIVNFERPTEEGFDSARCVLPDYKWIQNDGYSDSEMEFFEKLLQSNAHLIYKYAASGGVRIAQFVSAQFFLICSEWKRFFVEDEMNVYC